MEAKRFDHAGVLVGHVDKCFAILLWAHDILLVPLVGCQLVAILPWSWDLRKAWRQ